MRGLSMVNYMKKEVMVLLLLGILLISPVVSSLASPSFEGLKDKASANHCLALYNEHNNWCNSDNFIKNFGDNKDAKDFCIYNAKKIILMCCRPSLKDLPSNAPAYRYPLKDGALDEFNLCMYEAKRLSSALDVGKMFGWLGGLINKIFAPSGPGTAGVVVEGVSGIVTEELVEKALEEKNKEIKNTNKPEEESKEELKQKIKVEALKKCVKKEYSNIFSEENADDVDQNGREWWKDEGNESQEENKEASIDISSIIHALPSIKDTDFVSYSPLYWLLKELEEKNIKGNIELDITCYGESLNANLIKGDSKDSISKNTISLKTKESILYKIIDSKFPEKAFIYALSEGEVELEPKIMQGTTRILIRFIPQKIGTAKKNPEGFYYIENQIIDNYGVIVGYFPEKLTILKAKLVGFSPSAGIYKTTDDLKPSSLLENPKDNAQEGLIEGLAYQWESTK